MDRREIIWGGMFWAAALFICATIASLNSHSCPAGHWSRKPQWDAGLSALSVVELKPAGALLFDGKSISWADLRPLLLSIAKLPIQPVVVFKSASGADCGDIIRVRSIMDHSLDCQSGGCAEGSEWDSFRPHGPNV